MRRAPIERGVCAANVWGADVRVGLGFADDVASRLRKGPLPLSCKVVRQRELARSTSEHWDVASRVLARSGGRQNEHR